MAAKNLDELVKKLGIKNRIAAVIALGPTHELVQRIETESRYLEREIIGELKDYLAHSIARYTKTNNAMDSYELLTNFVIDLLNGNK
jgi:deoxyadenosine/deoxycytidine kinase